MKKKLRISCALILIILGANFSYTQTPGVIVEGDPTITGGLYPNGTPLDPNGDGYVSLLPSLTPSQYTNIGFPANILDTDVNDVLYSEIAYVGIPEITSEPTADLNKGPNCAFTDLVQDADSRSSYYNTDGTNMRFRFRLGGAASNSKGYSILIDTDEKFGFSGPNADPDAVPGNPGFEIEIVLRTNFSVDAYNIDGAFSVNPQLIIAKNYTTHAIKSLALTTVCDDPDYFYDFYIPFSDVTGIDATTKLRMVSVTSINPKGIIGNNGTSDIAGVDDSQNTTDTSYEIAIDTQTPSNGDPIERAACPSITGPIAPGTSIAITGTTNNTLGTGETVEIEIFVDGLSVATTTTATSSWNSTIPGPTTNGQIITATATVKNSADVVVKGTSTSNCDPEVISDIVCTAPAAPVAIQVGNSGKDLEGTITGLNGISVIIEIFNNGIKVLDWGNAAPNDNSGNFTVTVSGTGAWKVAGGGGFKAPSGYFSVIITPQSGASSGCASPVSNSLAYCRTSGGGADGIASGTITLATPTTILTTTQTISGILGNTNTTTVKLFKNNADTNITPTIVGTSWEMDISSLTLVAGDVLFVSNKETAATCTSISTSKTVVSRSIAPIVNLDGCFDGNATQISGTSSEIGGTIRLYTRVGTGVTTSDSQVGTTPTVDANGNWTVTGLNIPSGNSVAVTVQNTGETVSTISNEVLISSKTTFTTLLISSDPIIEGDASINGTSSGLPTGSTIQLYLDGDKAFNSSGNELTTTTDGSGNWEFLTLDTPLEILYTNAIVTVTATSTVAGSCESDQSSSKVVICNPPTTPVITVVSTTPICENGIFTVTIVDAQPGLLYQLVDQDNNSVGPSFLGPSTAADTTIDTDPIPFGTTSLKVRASKIFGTCTTVESNAIAIVVNPSPTITFGPNPFATFSASAQTVDLTYTDASTTNPPTQYKIAFDNTTLGSANTASSNFISLTSSPIVNAITIPANLPKGVYTATVTIKETTTTESCEKSYPITITILDALAPEITLTPSVALCAGTTTANFAYSATNNNPNQYSIDFSDAANLQGFIDITDVALPATSITVTVPPSPNGGTYTGLLRLKNASGNISKEYPISIAIEKTTPGIIAGNQIISSGANVTAFTSTEDATGLGGVTYQWKSSTSLAGPFSNIGTNSPTFDESTIITTTYYKRIATSVTNGCEAESNVITVKVIALTGIPMITQVYQVGNEKWIEITNTSTSTINTNEIKVVLFRDKNRVFDGQTPDASLTITSGLLAGQSVLIKNTLSTTVTNINGSPLINDSLTEIEGGNDMIILSTTTDATAWANRYDIVSNISNKTSLVRIDETTSANNTFTESEWVTFIDDAISIYGDQSTAAQEGRHPHASLISEITGSSTDANTLLGLHRIGSTTRTGTVWNNGFPDRSRFVIIDEDYSHGTTKLSARKLTVNNKLGIENLLVVTNDVVLGASGEVRLIDDSGNSNAQFIQTHTAASLVSGSGKLLVDQNSTVPSIYRYNYMSSPVKNSAGAGTFTIASVFKDGTNPTDFNGIINAATATGIAKTISILSGNNYDGNFTGSPEDAITLADYWMYTYASSGGGRANWFQTRSGGSIANTNGFIFKGPGRPQNYTFLGIPKDGTITTSVGKDESYLVGNPYPSAISVKEFIEDNISAITGTLYFWKHAGENVSSGIDGHYFAGYIGGYATRTITTGVTAKAENLSGETLGPVDLTLQAEDATFSGDIETIDGTNVILLNSATDSITFKNITKGIDSLRIRYQSNLTKSINIKVNGISKLTVSLESTGSGVLSVKLIPLCVLVGSDITIASTDTNGVQIDYLNLYDLDGAVECTPSAGDAIFTEPEAYIPIGQGFFVAGDSDGGDIVFDNSQREYKTEGAGSSVFFRSSKKSSNLAGIPIIKIGMDHKGSNSENLHRQLAISFNSFQSFDHDKGYDAEMFDVDDTDVYWKFPNNETKYVIAGVQSISNDLEVPLEINMDYSGNVTLMLDEIKNYSGNLYITDKFIGESYNIKNEKATILLEKGTYSDRFVLAFKPSGALSVLDEIINSYTSIYIDNKNDIINIIKNEEINIKTVSLINILGKTVSIWNIEESKREYQLKINKKLPVGVYVVKLNSDKGKTNKKIIIE